MRVKHISSCSDIFNGMAANNADASQITQTQRNMSQSIAHMISSTPALSAADGASIVHEVGASGFSSTFKQILTECVAGRLCAHGAAQQDNGNKTQKMCPDGALA